MMLENHVEQTSGGGLVLDRLVDDSEYHSIDLDRVCAVIERVGCDADRVRCRAMQRTLSASVAAVLYAAIEPV